ADRPHAPGNLRAPAGQVVGHLHVHRGELRAPHLDDYLSEDCWPATGMPAEDRPESLPLRLVSALVDEQRHRDLSACPGVALELAARDQVQPVQADVAVVALAHVIGEHALAVVTGRRLRELARTRD